MEIPEVQPRRPFWDDSPDDGYFESDRDFMENNFDACLWFLEHREELARQINRDQPATTLNLNPQRSEMAGFAS